MGRPSFPTVWDLPVWARALHVFFLLWMGGQILYGAYQVFWVLQPEGSFGPVFGRAAELPFELMALRRLYALESWSAYVGFAVYLGVTEFWPRLIGLYLDRTAAADG